MSGIEGRGDQSHFRNKQRWKYPFDGLEWSWMLHHELYLFNEVHEWEMVLD
jgi:hypothetical protein